MHPSHDLVLWRERDLECVMITCCTGAELQLRRVSANGREVVELIVRELYPTKSDLYERATLLRREHQG